ncbi:RNA-directed DNA polymerase, eukaryota, reverse transcriptase zinc-binding domain protein [Tanacetum coccineum]
MPVLPGARARPPARFATSTIYPFSDFVSKRKIFASGLPLSCKVADLINNGAWVWPEVLTNSFDALSIIPPPMLVQGKPDVVKWKSKNGGLYDFSVSTVWDDIRKSNPVVPWAKLVWFSQCIPHHSFILWLAILGRLKTHDSMRNWDKVDNLTVWGRLKDMVKLDHAPFRWSDILKFLLNRPINKSIWSILQRLRVLSLNLNPSAQVYDAADLWNFHVSNEPGSKKVKFVSKKKFSC